MKKTCEMCGGYFLTESDPHVFIPRPNKVIYYCLCMINNSDSVEKLQAENKKLRKALEYVYDACHPKEQKVIEEALKEIKE